MIEKESSQEVYGFIITKPLQLMIVLALFDQLPTEVKKELLIVNYFTDAEQVSIRLAKVISKECKVIFFRNDLEAFKMACNKKYNKLFMDSDVGFSRNLTLINLKVRSRRTVLAVYEEGLGTYRDDLYLGIKKIILKALGCGVNFGGNFLTRELYVYKIKDIPCRSSKLVIFQIKTNVENLIVGKKDLLTNIFNSEGMTNLKKIKAGSRCVLYLTGWYEDNECIKILEKSFQKYFIKRHPHLKNKIYNESCGVNVDSGIPAEIIIDELCSHYERVLVIHHGSSVGRYINNKKIKFITVDSFKENIKYVKLLKHNSAML